MNPYYQNGTLRLYQADARTIPLADESVHCVVTSPPYWGLRDYGLEPQVWGGDAEHGHEWMNKSVATEVGRGNWSQGTNGRGELQPGGIDAKREPIRSTSTVAFCSCGAWRGSLGLEPTPELYVEHIVEIFREVRRVLRDDGTVWLNLAPSFYSNPGNGRGGGATLGGGQPHLSGTQRVGRSGTGGKGQRGSIGHGSASRSLCDECATVLSSRSPGTGVHHGQEPETSTSESTHSRKERQTDRSNNSGLVARGDRTEDDPSDPPPSQGLVIEPLLASQESTPLPSSDVFEGRASSQRRENAEPSTEHLIWRGVPLCEYMKGAPFAVCSSPRVAQESVEEQENTDGIEGTVDSWAGRTSDRASGSSSYLHYSTLSRHLKPKDMVAIPWLVALALQKDGWWLRSDIIWSKPNPMPESVTDRPTRAHEDLFLLTKSARYYYDADAIRELSNGWNRSLLGDGKSGEAGIYHRQAVHGDPEGSTGRNKRSVWEIATQPFGMEMCEACGMIYTAAMYGRLPHVEYQELNVETEEWETKKAKRCRKCHRHDAWMSHFATFPEKLVEPCILAGCPSGGTVLDPFCGSGSVNLVAQRLGRQSVGVDLSPHYLALAATRMGQTAMELAI